MSRFRRLLDRAPALARVRRVRQAGAAALVGALAFAVVGDSPASSQVEESASTAWNLSTIPAPDLSSATARLAASPLWASQPAVVPAAAAESPPPRLIGTIPDGRGGRQALFLDPDGGRLRGAVGEPIPGLGRLLRVEATRVRWRDDDGDELEAMLFSDGTVTTLPSPKPAPES